MFIKAFNILLAKTKDGRSPIYPGSIVEVEDEVGRYFVSVKAAQEITCPAAQATNLAPVAVVPGERTRPTGVSAPEGPSEGETEDIDLNTLSYNQLKVMAQEMGIETGKIKSKAGMIAAIEDVATGIPSDGDVPPVFDAQEVIDE